MKWFEPKSRTSVPVPDFTEAWEAWRADIAEREKDLRSAGPPHGSFKIAQQGGFWKVWRAQVQTPYRYQRPTSYERHSDPPASQSVYWIWSSLTDTDFVSRKEAQDWLQGFVAPDPSSYLYNADGALIEVKAE